MSVNTILDELEEIQKKLDRIMAHMGFTGIMKPKAKEPTKELVVAEKLIVKGGRTIPAKGSGKYEWFPVKDLPGVKVRACSNEGCPYFLKYNEEKGKYEHWKYDPNTKEGGFVQDNCDYFLSEGF